ncbi:hypothetical protein MES5069_190030 [Mesorhizobium escarrei]|uniref:Uncharacterized protein n=1 Tax=Mesorhizobium escarrei TaxID=666018 RepID=A0ABM9DPV0_9HYPH|nr:hypothetical protein MES5069_190030 [Mesorhizobium escarrei]
MSPTNGIRRRCKPDGPSNRPIANAQNGTFLSEPGYTRRGRRCHGVLPEQPSLTCWGRLKHRHPLFGAVLTMAVGLAWSVEAGRGGGHHRQRSIRPPPLLPMKSRTKRVEESTFQPRTDIPDGIW